ncbi:MAG TPA: DUF2934 domain-containing protein [Patescibacteria group bacterium]|jgi:hypothetical protein|nr:DUF2934 domain-containing protein [Patescibacteria group bacterium]
MNKNMEKSVTENQASVSRIAYELWENAGRPVGRDLEFWLAAEAKLRAAGMPRHGSAATNGIVKETASKGLRSNRGGLKKTWPKPYPNLPKF